MKNFIKCSFLSVTMLFCIGLHSAYGQSQWVIRFNDGSEKAFNINDIKEMFPREKAPETIPQVRIAIYETVPGYSVRDVMFYDSDAHITPRCILFTYTDNGTWNYDFGRLNYTDAEAHEKTGTAFLGRTSATASFAGNAEDNYYIPCFPNEENEAVFNLRVKYSLEAIDGSGETINIPDATVQIPVEYTQWKRGYTYTYFFKIYDVSTSYTAGSIEDIYHIALDSVVIESADGSTTR